MKSNTYSFAERELDTLSKSATDPDNRPIIEPFRNEILALCEAFGKSGQSGGSAPFTASAIAQAVKKLMLQNPIMPMTGIDDEWVNVAENNVNQMLIFQNKRCSALFKEGSSNLSAYYLDAIIWKDQNGMTTCGMSFLKDGTAIYSRNYVKSFPFTPKTFYIDVICEEVALNDFEWHIKDPKQLNRVWKYYTRYV